MCASAGTHGKPSQGCVSLCFLCFTAVHVNKRDIIFLLDGSDNVGKNNFPYVRDFVTNLVNSLDVGSDNIRVGLVQFSDTPVTEFSLDTYQTKSELLAHLRSLQLKGGSGLNTGSALSYVHANHFTEAGGSRTQERVPQLLLLLMAGPSEDSYLQAANALVRSGVLTFCVGANQADKAELEHIAFNPSLVYLMDDFSSLPTLPQQLIQPLTTYVSGGVQEVPLTQPGNLPPLLLLRMPPWQQCLMQPCDVWKDGGFIWVGLVEDTIPANSAAKSRTFSYAQFVLSLPHLLRS